MKEEDILENMDTDGNITMAYTI